MVVFRSLLVPLKAVIMNLLSIGAAYGVVVAVFQWGWGSSFFGVGKEGPIEAWAPIMMFAIVFGLSMDYEVFLLSRIKEEYDRTHDNAHGRRRRARGHRPRDHRGGRDHGVRVRQLRARRRPRAQGVRPRARGRGARRRNHRPARARARDDGAARRPQLVDPALARPDPARRSTSSRSTSSTPSWRPSTPSPARASSRARPRRRSTGRVGRQRACQRGLRPSRSARGPSCASSLR